MATPRNCCSPLNVIKPQRSTDCCLPPRPEFTEISTNVLWINQDNGIFNVPTEITQVNQNTSLITFNDSNPGFFNSDYYYEADTIDISGSSLEIIVTLPENNNPYENGTVLSEYYSDIPLLYGCGLESDSGAYKGYNFIQNDGIYPSTFTYIPGQTIKYIITATDQTVYLNNEILSYRTGTDFDSPAWKLQLANYGADTSDLNQYLYTSVTWRFQVSVPPLRIPIIYPPKVVGLIGNCYVRRPDRNNVSESQRMLRQQCTTVTINKQSKTVVSAVPLDVSAVAVKDSASASTRTSQTKDAVLLAFENNPAMRFNEFLGPLPPANPCPPPFFNAGVPKPSVIGCGPGTIKPFNP